MGLKPDKPIEKPEALILYEKVKATGLPLRAGGVLDQPHIWMEEYYVVWQESNVFDALEKQRQTMEAEQRK